MGHRSVFAGFSSCLPLAFSSGYRHVKRVTNSECSLLSSVRIWPWVQFIEGVFPRHAQRHHFETTTIARHIEEICVACFVLQLSNAEPCNRLTLILIRHVHRLESKFVSR